VCGESCNDLCGLISGVQILLQDQVLSSMQQKLDSLCEQVNNARDHSGGRVEMAFTKNVESSCNDAFGSDQITFVDCGCWFCDQHRVLYNGLAVRVYFYEFVNVLLNCS
jgi:hypothetical protein